MKDDLTVERAKARTFRDLMVWRKAHELVLTIYRFTQGLSKGRALRADVTF